MVFPFELFLQAVRCCRHAYIIAHVRHIVKPKTGNVCEKIFIEDGSAVRCDEVVKEYEDQLNVRYFFKPNSGIAIPAAV